MSTLKTLALTALLGTVPFAYVQAQSPTAYVLAGKLDKVTSPAKVYLRREGLQQRFPMDSAEVVNGRFELRGISPAPTKAKLVLVVKGNRRRLLNGKADNAPFYLEPGTTVFSSPDSLLHATITGSPLSTQLQALLAAQRPAFRRLQQVWGAHWAASEATRQTSEFQLSQETKEAAAKADIRAALATFIRANPASQVGFDAVKETGGSIPNYTEVAPLFDLLAPELKATPEGRAYGVQLAEMQRVAVGAQAPEFTLRTANGKKVSLSDYRGKYVLVDFWASWCGPCRRDNPNVVKVYNEFKDRNFDVLGVSIDNPNERDKWLRAIQDDQLPWTQVGDRMAGARAEVQATYAVRAIPQNFLIDPSGKIVGFNLHGAALRSALAKLIL